MLFIRVVPAFPTEAIPKDDVKRLVMFHTSHSLTSGFYSVLCAFDLETIGQGFFWSVMPLKCE